MTVAALPAGQQTDLGQTGTAVHCGSASQSAARSSERLDANRILLLGAGCQALAIFVAVLGDCARNQVGGHERLLYLAIRQGLLIVLGGLEVYAGRPRTYLPKHSR